MSQYLSDHSLFTYSSTTGSPQVMQQATGKSHIQLIIWHKMKLFLQLILASYFLWDEYKWMSGSVVGFKFKPHYVTLVALKPVKPP